MLPGAGSGSSLWGIVTLVVTVGAMLVLAAPGVATPPAPADGVTVFQRNIDGFWDLFALIGDGSTPNLTNTPGRNEVNPSFSWDGSTIAYSDDGNGDREYDAFFIDFYTRKKTQLTSGPESDLFTSMCQDGSIAVQRISSQTTSDILLFPPGGGSPQNLTGGLGFNARPVCTVDGTIGYVSDLTGKFVPRIWSDGTTANLADLPREVLDIDLSPDGKTLVYAGRDADNIEIFTYDLTTLLESQITFSTPPAEQRLPRFAPGSDDLLWTVRATDTGGEGIVRRTGPGQANVVIADASSAVVQPLPACTLGKSGSTVRIGFFGTEGDDGQAIRRALAYDNWDEFIRSCAGSETLQNIRRFQPPKTLALDANLGGGNDHYRYDPWAFRLLEELGWPEDVRTQAVIDAGPGTDTIVSGPRNDRIDVRDGERDVVNAGKGKDTVIADQIDVVKNAENVTRR